MPNDEGTLFKNDKKREGKQDADYTGQLSIDGKEFWLNAWINTARDGGKKYMKLKAKPKTGARGTQQRKDEWP